MTITLNLLQIFVVAIAIYCNYYFFNEFSLHGEIIQLTKRVLFILAVESILFLAYYGAMKILWDF